MARRAAAETTRPFTAAPGCRIAATQFPPPARFLTASAVRLLQSRARAVGTNLRFVITNRLAARRKFLRSTAITPNAKTPSKNSRALSLHRPLELPTISSQRLLSAVAGSPLKTLFGKLALALHAG